VTFELTLEQAAQRADVSRGTLLKWVWNGDVAAKRLKHGGWKISTESLTQWLSTPDNPKKGKACESTRK
jgi:excisionase family DNA binding protein